MVRGHLNMRPKLRHRSVFGEADRRMVLGEGADPCVRMVRQPTATAGPDSSIGSQHLAPSVDDGVAAVAADDRGRGGQSDCVPVGCPEFDLLGVVEGLHTGSHLVQRALGHQCRSRCRSSAAQARSQPGLAQRGVRLL
jgi:hypothetical protein